MTAAQRIHAFLEAVDRDRGALPNPAALGAGWIVPGSAESVEGPRVIRLRDLV